MEDLVFDTTNESIEYSKPKINSGEYEFVLADIKPTKDKSRTNFILDIEFIRFGSRLLILEDFFKFIANLI